MGLTLTNINSLQLLNILNTTTRNQSNSLTRLSTGSRINSGKDDPAGLIAMRSLQTELTATNAALANNQRTDSMLNVADKAMNEVSSLINEIKSLAVASANSDGLSGSELAANQAQIDNALAAIDNIINTTSFNGKKLLDGSLKIQSTGVNAGEISDLKIFGRNPDKSTSISVNVTQAASQANLQLMTAAVSADSKVQVQGKDGTAIIDITDGEALSSVVAKINNATANTGVTASLVGGNVELYSKDFGSDSFVRTTRLEGATSIAQGSDNGVDAKVTVNGQTAAVDGKNVAYSSNGVSISFSLTDAYNQAGGTSTFSVSNTGGATFQLGTSSSTRATIGLDGLFTAQLGSSAEGFLATLRGGGTNSIINNPNQAAKIASLAAEQLATSQGRLGGFQKFQVQTALNQQTALKESLTSAISTIRDVDFAVETAELNRQNVLLQSAIQLLGLSNQQGAQVLSLL